MMLRSTRAALAALALCAPAWAQSPTPGDFAWRGQLQLPQQASLVRVTLPAQAMVRLQTRDAADVRVFDARAQALPHALASTPPSQTPPRDRTSRYAALPLSAAPPQGTASKGAVQVHVVEGGAQRSVWVQLKPGSAAPSGPDMLPSVLFDTRAEKRRVTGLLVHAQLRSNRPLPIRVSTSSDLVQWTEVPTRGSLFRFEGESAPANETLELEGPLALEGRYLRLDWDAGEDIQVTGVTGLVAPAAPRPPRVFATLHQPVTNGAAALEWELGFATPIAELHLDTSKANTLVPVRILGRNAVSEPWRLLGRAVVWRLGAPGSDHANPPLELQAPSVRWLRVEATHGMRLQDTPLTARAGFEPVQVVFVAGGEGPYQLAAGRAGTPAAALPVSMLTSAGSVKIDSLPAATVAQAVEAPAAPRTGVAAWLPRGVEPRTALLWAVLGGGVLLLGGVAWSLLRQLNRKDEAPGA